MLTAVILVLSIITVLSLPPCSSSKERVPNLTGQILGRSLSVRTAPPEIWLSLTLSLLFLTVQRSAAQGRLPHSKTSSFALPRRRASHIFCSQENMYVGPYSLALQWYDSAIWGTGV